ncbi:EF-hand domain-containing protein [Cupriavidus sp. AU9028]|uniref:EF-hand domain-containing protein n=1 Tax=Cupriavidus sp. AU9028 TaxID=2871157 RepID=UPI001C98A888|nr:EF-hand domain-containing protein [Cupriavidus sp. AU9028]MBY4898988.1 EF-hand domain-containing protein [Cupriavidus sp. AU9028]
MRSHTIKSRPVQQFLAASAVFLAMGGTALAQAQTNAQPQAPAQQAAPTQAAPHHKEGGHRGEHRHRGHHHHHHAAGMMWMNSVDTDRDGAVSKAEADAIFARIDANKDGKLDREEMRAYQKAQHEQHRAQMRERFEASYKAADKNGDGALTREEAQSGMPGLAKRFDRVDADKDGKVTRDEIGNAMRQAHAKRHGERGQRGNNGTPPTAPSNPAAPSTEGA